MRRWSGRVRWCGILGKEICSGPLMAIAAAEFIYTRTRISIYIRTVVCDFRTTYA